MESPLRDFTSIHNHSHFSMMDGISLPEEMVVRAKECGLKSIALTDHGHAHGHADFYLSGKKHGVRTILGVEAYVIDDLQHWKEEKEKHDEGQDEDATNTGSYKRFGRKGHLVLLACNREGLANLYRLVFLSHKEGFYGKPRMDKAMLRTYGKGLVASSACMGGVVSNKLWAYKDGQASWADVVSEAKQFDEIFGRGRFFLELQFNESEGQRFINSHLVRIHQETGIPLSVTVDSHYVKENDWEIQEFMYMLRGNKTLGNRGDWKFDIKQLYIKSPAEMWKTYELYGSADVPQNLAMEAFQNTLLIDSLIDDFEPDTRIRLPKLKDVESPFHKLGETCINELRKRGFEKDQRYVDQLFHELKIIKDKGIANYFLIVQQMISEARKKMRVGPGRGSSAGSLICYLMDITQLDPIRHDLLFERFINPDRVELPDIDVDFQDPDVAKELLRQMFGESNVACISTFGTFQIKGLLKDLGRVFEIDVNEVNKVNRQIEKDVRILYTEGQDKSTIVIKLEDLERVSKAYNEFVDKHPVLKRYIPNLYGRNRHVGRHASGVVIGDELPAETATFTSKGIVQTSFTDGIVNKNLTAMGLVKFDILGLETLAVIDYTLKLVSRRTGKSYEELSDQLLEHNMDLKDTKLLKTVFWDGHMGGIFQFSGKGIRRLAQRVKPDGFEDVSAICSIYRPGALHSGMDDLFVQNKFTQSAIEYGHPILEEILRPTFGCMIYQEQLLNIGLKLGKMSMKDVNRLRKLFLKKDKSKTDDFLDKEKAELKGKLLKGCAENGYPEEKAAQLWEDFSKWGGYGFNAAHSKAYALVSYQTAWLATYYPLEIYAASLTLGQSSSLQSLVSDIQRRGIKVLPVDVNKSKLEHTVEIQEDGTPGIRLSLTSVLGVGRAAAEGIVLNQPYESFPEFLEKSGASKTSIQPLIMIGSFDSLTGGMPMKVLEKRYDDYVENPKWKTKKHRQVWLDLWNSAHDGVDYPLHERVFAENTLLGFSLRGSPFEILDRDKKIEQLFPDRLPYSELLASDDETIVFPVVVKEIKEKADKRKQMMAFLKMGTEGGEEFETVAFSTVWKHVAKGVRKGSVYLATFNRKLEEPDRLVLGRPGFAHSAHSAAGYMIDLDDVEL